MHLEFLVEERSAEALLRILVPKIVPGITFGVHPFQGKQDLLKKLPARLRAYAPRMSPERLRIVVLIDEDREDCRRLKLLLEEEALKAGLVTKTRAAGRCFEVLNRIAVEELEAWYFGDTEALRSAYSRVPESLSRKAAFREPDGIRGGTWEALERVLKDAGYHPAGLEKIRAAREIAEYMDPDRNMSPSFRVFRDGLRAIVSA